MQQTRLNGRYELLEKLGEGGVAIVYRAQDTLLDRVVAVKILRQQLVGDPTFLERFRREAQAAARLSHPNIIGVYDVGQDGDQYYIVMEYVDGYDLKVVSSPPMRPCPSPRRCRLPNRSALRSIWRTSKDLCTATSSRRIFWSPAPPHRERTIVCMSRSRISVWRAA